MIATLPEDVVCEKLGRYHQFGDADWNETRDAWCRHCGERLLLPGSAGSDEQTHHHSHHPGEYRPFGFDTTWCSSCDRPIDQTKFGEHTCRPDEIGRPCSFKGDPS